MAKYLGEEVVNIKDTEFKDFKESDWVMYYIERYGQIDGGHHKQWVLDQIARILNGTKIIIKLAKWDDGQQEYRIDTGKPSKKYLNWVKEMKNPGDDEEDDFEYDYDKGIAP